MTDEEIKKVFEIQRKIDEKRQKKAFLTNFLPKSAVFEIPPGKHGKSQLSPVESTFLKIEQLEKEITRAEISAIKKLGLAKEVHEQKLAEGQKIAELITQAKIKMGEILNSLPKATSGNGSNQFQKKIAEIDKPVEFSSDTKEDIKDTSPKAAEQQKTKAEVIADIGLTQKQAERLQTMAKENQYIKVPIDTPVEKQTSKPKAEVIADIGLTQKQAERLQTMAKNQDIVQAFFKIRNVAGFGLFSNDSAFNFT